MRIIMLGHSGVGKTTYMASMYGALQTPVKGFSLRAANTTHHQELWQLYHNIRNGQYPLPNWQRQRYDFSLLFQGQSFFPFEWIDYRGGALEERSSSEQTSQLISDLRYADGIVMFCNSDPAEEGKVIRQINRLMQFVNQSLQDRWDPATIVIVFTKCDLTKKPDEELYAPTRNLVEAISHSETVVGTLISVACGKAFVNVEIPVLFSLGLGVLMEKHVLAKEVEYYQEKEREYDKDFFNLVKNIRRMRQGEETTWKQSSQARQNAQERLEKITTLVKPSEELAKHLGKSWRNRSWRHNASTAHMATSIRWSKVENLIQPEAQLAKYLKKLPIF